ncbi:MAG: LysR family transcriptional regulator [Rhizobiaceae bacterium]|nr:LysR family transcriptional regulator [Rhizobiaceae bacterium]
MKNDIGWEFWRTFLAVAKTGSLSAAARRLSLTQPTVGRHVDSLEAAVGAPLFTRSQTGLVPTATALALVPHAEAMAASAEALKRTASGEAEAESGVVRLAASEIMGVEVLPSLLAPFRAAHPGVVLEVALSNQQENLLRRDADLAVRMARPTQEALVARRIGQVPIGLYAHRSYAERRRLPANPAEIFEHELIGVDRDAGRLGGLAIAGRPLTPDVFGYRSDSDLAQLAALRAGLGIGVCQVALARRSPDLIPVLPDQIQFHLEMWLVMHEDLRTSRRIRLLFDHLSGALSEYVRAAASPRDEPMLQPPH